MKEDEKEKRKKRKRIRKRGDNEIKRAKSLKRKEGV